MSADISHIYFLIRHHRSVYWNQKPNSAEGRMTSRVKRGGRQNAQRNGDPTICRVGWLQMELISVIRDLLEASFSEWRFCIVNIFIGIIWIWRQRICIALEVSTTFVQREYGKSWFSWFLRRNTFPLKCCSCFIYHSKRHLNDRFDTL